VIGVLAVTVTLGKFSELRSQQGSQRAQVAALVDVRPDAEKRAGSLLEHPYLPELVKQRKPGDPFPAVYFSDDRLSKLRQAVESAEGRGEIDTDYVDPVAGPYQGSWLAAIRPVVVDAPSGTRSTGWVVVVQERLEDALGPAQALGRKLVRSGLIALGVVIAVVTALWGFVMIVLNESPRFGLGNLIKRRAGIPATGLSVNAGSAVGTPKTARDSNTEQKSS
jgi:hypothetical protein